MNRRGFLAGVAGFLAAPAIVRASSLMPVSAQPMMIKIEPYIIAFAGPDAPAWIMYGGQMAFNDWVYDVGGPPPDAAFAS